MEGEHTGVHTLSVALTSDSSALRSALTADVRRDRLICERLIVNGCRVPASVRPLRFRTAEVQVRPAAGLVVVGWTERRVVAQRIGYAEDRLLPGRRRGSAESTSGSSGSDSARRTLRPSARLRDICAQRSRSRRFAAERPAHRVDPSLVFEKFIRRMGHDVLRYPSVWRREPTPDRKRCAVPSTGCGRQTARAGPG